MISAIIKAIRQSLSDKQGQGVLWNAGSLALIAISGIALNVLVVNIRTEAALGIFNQVYAIYIMLSQIGVGGLQHSTLMHISYNQADKKACADAVGSAMILVGLFGTAVTILTILTAQWVGVLFDSASVGNGLKLAAPALLFFGWNKVLINTLNGLEHVRSYAAFRSARPLLLVVSITLLSLSLYNDASLSLALVITEASLFVALISYTYGYALPFPGIYDIRVWMRRHISYGIRGFFSGVLLELNTRVDVLVLGYFLTDNMVGIYSFAAMFAEGASQLPLAVRWTLDPTIGKLFVQNNHDAIGALSRKTRKWVYPAMLAIGLVSIIIFPLMTMVLAPSLPIWLTSGIFTIIMIGVIINAGFRPFSGLLLQGGRPGLYTVFILILVLNDALLNVVFIPICGIHGAAWVTALTYTLEAVGLILIARIFFRIQL